MKPEEFCRWLQGMFDISALEELDEDQIDVIRVHLNTVFQDVTGMGTRGMRKPVEEPRWVRDRNPFEDPTVTCSSSPEILDEISFCASDPPRTDPYAKENALKIMPGIKTVMSC